MECPCSLTLAEDAERDLGVRSNPHPSLWASSQSSDFTSLFLSRIQVELCSKTAGFCAGLISGLLLLTHFQTSCVNFWIDPTSN